MIDIRNFYFYTNSKDGIGNSFLGSHRGMRFAVEPKKGEEKNFFAVDIWPEPWAREITPNDRHIKAEFDLTPGGCDRVKNFLEKTYSDNKTEYKEAASMGFSEALKNRK